jgi:hypothetical protein
MASCAAIGNRRRLPDRSGIAFLIPPLAAIFVELLSRKKEKK